MKIKYPQNGYRLPIARRLGAITNICRKKHPVLQSVLIERINENTVRLTASDAICLISADYRPIISSNQFPKTNAKLTPFRNALINGTEFLFASKQVEKKAKTAKNKCVHGH